MSDKKYNFYQSSQQSIEDLMLEVADTEIHFNKLMDRALNEDFSQDSSKESDLPEIKKEFDLVMEMLDAAKSGLGIANKLKDQESSRRHRGKVLGNLNKIRANLTRLGKNLDTVNKG